MGVDVSTTKAAIHDLIDRMDDETIATLLVYARQVLKASGRDEQSLRPELDDRMGPLVVSGRSFIAEEDASDYATSTESRGTRPIKDFETLKSHSWPEDESVDDLVDAVRQWRREGGYA